MKSPHFPVPTVLIEYKDFLISAVRKLPKLVWGTFAVIGILVVGFLLGVYVYTSTSDPDDPERMLTKENMKLRNLIDDYEELSDLYYKQGQNVNIALDPEVYATNPDQSYEAVIALKQFREMIIDKQREIEDLKNDVRLD